MKPPFQVDFVLDQASVKVGSKLTGKIVLPNEAVSNSTKAGSIKAIQIHFLGWEETKATHVDKMHHTEGIDDHRNHRVVVRDKRDVCSLLLFEKYYTKGKSVDQIIPIDIRLPKDLPPSLRLSFAEAFGLQEPKPSPLSFVHVAEIGSINFITGDRSPDYAQIMYKVQVSIERRGFLKRKLNFDKVVPVLPKPTCLTVGAAWESVPTIQAPKLKKLLGRTGVARKIYVGVRLPTGQHVEIGQNLIVDLSVINMSRSTIDKVEMTLQEKYKWYAKRYSQVAGDHNKQAKSFGWLGDSVMDPQAEAAVTSDPSALQRKMRSELDQATHRQFLTIPYHCKPDFQGKLMNVTHVLNIHVTTKKMFGPTDINIPITLHLATSLPVAQATCETTVPTIQGHPFTPSGPIENQNQPNPYIHPNVSTHNPTTASSAMIHPNVECDGCKQYPLRGIRYHCEQGKHDYCQNCYNANSHMCFIDKNNLYNYTDVIYSQPFSSSYIQSPPHSAPSTTLPVAQGFHPMIERKVGDAAIWEDHPLPQAKGFQAWIGKQLLGSMGIDPYAPMSRQVPQVPFTPVPFTRPEDVCVNTLRTQLATHPDPVSVVVQNLQQSPSSGSWRALLSTLKPEDFGDIVGSVPVYHRQSPVAEKMVPYIHNFSCQHLLEALKQAQYNGVRNRMLATLTAYCIDYKQNKRRVNAVLSETEQAFFQSGFGYGRCCG